ncbi:hypothetical protein D3C72_848620 [compost metagenome]
MYTAEVFINIRFPGYIRYLEVLQQGHVLVVKGTIILLLFFVEVPQCPVGFCHTLLIFQTGIQLQGSLVAGFDFVNIFIVIIQGAQLVI